MASWTPDQLRDLARRPKIGQIDIDNMRQALLYAARVIEAADAVLDDNRKLLTELNALKRPRGVASVAYVPTDAQLLGLLDGSGVSESRPLGQQLDLMTAWVRRCMAAWPAGVLVGRHETFCDQTPTKKDTP